MESDLRKVLVIHGPNMNLLGKREPELYGTSSLGELDRLLRSRGKDLAMEVSTTQSNSEGDIIDRIQCAAGDGFSAIVINPAGYTNTSIAIRDAVLGCGLPTVEVHLTNVFAREAFRQNMITAGACVGLICGLGIHSYLVALTAIAQMLHSEA